MFLSCRSKIVIFEIWQNGNNRIIPCMTVQEISLSILPIHVYVNCFTLISSIEISMVESSKFPKFILNFRNLKSQKLQDGILTFWM